MDDKFEKSDAPITYKEGLIGFCLKVTNVKTYNTNHDLTKVAAWDPTVFNM